MTPPTEKPFEPTREQVEEWKPIVGYENVYVVNAIGEVKRIKTKGGNLMNKQMAVFPRGNGYPAVSLTHNGKNKIHNVHTLILCAFVGPRPSENHVACHKDGIRENSVLSNLQWGTYTENEADKEAHGTKLIGSRQHQSKLTESTVAEMKILYRFKIFNQYELADIYGCTQANVSLIMKGNAWAHVEISQAIDSAMNPK